MLHNDSSIHCRILVLHVSGAQWPFSVFLTLGPWFLKKGQSISYMPLGSGGGGVCNKPRTILHCNVTRISLHKSQFNSVHPFATFVSLTLAVRMP